MPSLRHLFALAGLLGLLVLPTAASAQLTAAPSHDFLFELRGFVKEPGHIPVPPPEGNLEDACGTAVDSHGDIYLSDYYHRTIDVYSPSRTYLTQIADPDPDGPCNLAVDSAGNVYVNHWRRDVVRFAPSQYPPTESTSYGSPTTIDFPSAPGARSTGVFLDPASGDLYVDDRTYVAVYEAAQLSQAEPEPVRKIGLGTLGQGYGVAVSDFPATAGEVYVPDASTDTVEVFGPAGEALAPIDGAGTPQRGFNSLADSDVAIDQTTGHIFVADNTEPGFEAPKAVIDEFNPAGAYRGQLPHSFVDAEPSALAVDGAGNVYATNGNTEGASLDGFGPTIAANGLKITESGTGEGAVTSEPAGIDCGTACEAEYNAGEEVTLTAVPDPGSAFAGWSGGGCNGTSPCHLTIGGSTEVSAEFEPAAEPLAVIGGPAGAAGAALGPPAAVSGPFARSPRASSHSSAHSSEVTQRGNLRVSFHGRLTPHALPRSGAAPVKVSVGAKIATTNGSNPPQLRKITIAINRNGRFDPAGLPVCSLEQIQPTTTADALAACRASLVGEGSFSAKVLLPQQAPFPSEGKVFAFNGTYKGKPAILAHVYGPEPIPTSYTIPFSIGAAKGTFGTVLRASLPQVTSEWGYVTGLQITLGRTFSSHGKKRSYLSAGCPAPKGFPGAVFPFAKASFAFGGRGTLTSVLNRSCGARG